MDVRVETPVARPGVIARVIACADAYVMVLCGVCVGDYVAIQSAANIRVSSGLKTKECDFMIPHIDAIMDESFPTFRYQRPVQQ